MPPVSKSQPSTAPSLPVDLLRPQAGTSPPSSLLFEHFVGRVAGLPFATLDDLRASCSAAAVEQITAEQSRLSDLRHDLVEALYAAIGRTDLKSIRSPLVALKRDLHNGRRPKPGLVAKLDGFLDPALATQLDRFRRLERLVALRVEELEALFDSELAEVRERFRAKLLDPDFRHGLLLSSTSLSTELPRYSRAAGRRPNSKLRQVERSLMRYFSRMVTKTTPFATFCSIVPGRLGDADTPCLLGDPRAKQSHLRLNKAVYRALVEHLTRRPAIRLHLAVESNPTLRRQTDHWAFLGLVDRLEVFQKAACHPALELVIARLEREPRPIFAKVVRWLTEAPEIAATAEQASAFVDQLLTIGLLRWHTAFAEQDADWDGRLGNLLTPIDDPHARRIGRALQRLRGCLDGYAAADLDRRRRLLSEVKTELRELFDDLEVERPLAVDQPPFYEDSASRAKLRLPAKRLDSATTALAELVELTAKIAYPRSEQATARHFFDRFYGTKTGTETDTVPLLQFYEDYYRGHFKAHLERRRTAPEPPPNEPANRPYDLANPFGLDVIEQVRRGTARLAQTVAERWRQQPDTRQIHLQRGDLETALGEVPELAVGCPSVSVFAQYAERLSASQRDLLITDGYTTGHGKYLSRFLYFLPQQIERDLWARNSRDCDHRLTEICADADFNANLHPPLLPWELSYPTGEALTGEHRLTVGDLEVGPEPGCPHGLRLSHRASGERVTPVDLGFLSPKMRPPLFQLLLALTPPSTFAMPLPDQPAGTLDEPVSESAEAVICRPRIVYRDCLVLARRRWEVGRRLFPRRIKGETEATYFLRLGGWRRLHGLPSRVFFSIQLLPSSGPQKHGPQIRQHLHKPQYLDFDNPLLVDLFSRSAEQLEHFRLTFEEVLPAPDQLLGPDGEGYATEVVLQLDFDRPPTEDCHEPC